MSTGDTVTVLALSGSLRSGSYNTALLRAAAELVPEGVRVEVAGIADIPMFNPDVLAASGFPPVVEALRARARAADAILFSTPEYNRSISGVLKNTIDWLSRGPDQVFDGKPVAVFSAGPGALGGALANHHLRQVMVFLNAHTLNGPEVMVGGAAQKFDAEGRLTDQSTRDFVAAHLGRLATFVRRLRG